MSHPQSLLFHSFYLNAPLLHTTWLCWILLVACLIQGVFLKYFQLSNSTNNPSFCPNRWADGSANMQTTSRWHSKCKSWWWKRPSWGSEQRGTIHKGLFQTKLPCSKLTWQQKVDLLSYWKWGISKFHVGSPFFDVFSHIKSHQKDFINRHIFSKKNGGQNASEIKFQGWSVSAQNSDAETESVSQALSQKQKQANIIWG